MCGLAGFTGFGNNLQLAEKANIIQQHRGPDNQSAWNDEFMAFAHQRLSIIDLSDAANQPFHKDKLMIVFNGEIYNYKELQKKLIDEKKVKFLTSSDTEVILELYRHYGSECLDHLIGMFVFAIYNKKTSDLFIARDHFGIKPLFYTVIGDGFAFSSELKTLVQIPGFNKQINPKAVVSSLNYRFVTGNDTMFRGTYKLPEAHYLTYNSRRELKIVRYWDLEEKKSGNGSIDEHQLREYLSKIMYDSVERHLVADVPVSSFLSGGLDSSLISIIARKINKSLSTYTIGHQQKDKGGESMPDDEKYANFLAEQFDLDHNVIRIKPDVMNDLPFMVKMLDEPIGDMAAINTYLICKAARDKGVKVILSGMGADEVFFGYRRQKATLMALRYSKLPAFIKNSINGIVKILPVKIGKKGIVFTRWAKRFLSFVSLPLDKSYMRSYSYYDTEELKRLLKPEYWSGIDEINIEHEKIFNAKFKGDDINQMCNTDLSMFMLGLNIALTDRASMAASVEVRVPFIDKIVISEGMNMPGRLKYKGKESKYILKKAAEDYLPKKIIYRPKASFSAPIRSWISNDLKGMVDDMLSEENINKWGMLNYEYVKELIEKDRSGIEDYAYQIFQILTLELWLREYMEN